MVVCDMVKKRNLIPLCRSTFLQDVTIELGRRSLKSIRYQNPTLEFDVAEEEVEGSPMERLEIETRNITGGITAMTIWANGVAWVYFRSHRNKASSEHFFQTHANFSGMTTEQIAQLLRDTLADPVSVRKLWEQRAIPE